MSKAGIIAAAYMLAVDQIGDKPVEENEPYVLPEGIPDRLCIEGHSRYHSAVTPYIGVRVDGEESNDVVEYCVSGKWVRLGVRGTPKGPILRQPGSLHALQTTERRGVKVEPYWRMQPSRQVRRALARGQ